MFLKWMVWALNWQRAINLSSNTLYTVLTVPQLTDPAPSVHSANQQPPCFPLVYLVNEVMLLKSEECCSKCFILPLVGDSQNRSTVKLWFSNLKCSEGDEPQRCWSGPGVHTHTALPQVRCIHCIYTPHGTNSLGIRWSVIILNLITVINADKLTSKI